MISITEKEFLETYPIGSLVAAYRSGYHEVVKVEARFIKKDSKYELVPEDHPEAIEINPRITVKQRFKPDGTIVKKGGLSDCDACYIVDMCKDLAGRIKKLEETTETLKDFLNQHNNAKTTN